MKGLEPILLTEPDPKSGAATNYATSADFFEGAKLQKIFDSQTSIFNLFFYKDVISRIKMTLLHELFSIFALLLWQFIRKIS